MDVGRSDVDQVVAEHAQSGHVPIDVDWAFHINAGALQLDGSSGRVDGDEIRTTGIANLHLAGRDAGDPLRLAPEPEDGETIRQVMHPVLSLIPDVALLPPAVNAA